MSRAGTGGALNYKAAYDAAGTMIRQELPGKLTQRVTTNELGDPTGLTYDGQITPVTASTEPVTGEVTWTPGTPAPGTWFAWSLDRDGLGRIVREYTGTGAGFDGNLGTPGTGDTDHLPVGQGLAFDRQYSYTARGQLAKVIDRTAAVPVGGIDPLTTPSDAPGLFCQVRFYGFNTDGARTSWKMENHGNGDCSGTVDATVSIGYSYDSANRLTTGATINGTSTGSYTYDGLGRQTIIPASDTPNMGAAISFGYYVDDLPASITQAGMSTTFSLDAAGRRATQTTTGGASDGQTVVRHYGDESDNPSWSVTTRKPGPRN